MIVEPIKRLLRNRKGGTAIEYGLIAALVVISMIVGLIQVADVSTTMWGNINNKVTAVRAG